MKISLPKSFQFPLFLQWGLITPLMEQEDTLIDDLIDYLIDIIEELLDNQDAFVTAKITCNTPKLFAKYVRSIAETIPEIDEVTVDIKFKDYPEHTEHSHYEILVSFVEARSRKRSGLKYPIYWEDVR